MLKSVASPADRLDAADVLTMRVPSCWKCGCVDWYSMLQTIVNGLRGAVVVLPLSSKARHIRYRRAKVPQLARRHRVSTQTLGIVNLCLRFSGVGMRQCSSWCAYLSMQSEGNDSQASAKHSEIYKLHVGCFAPKQTIPT